MLQSCSAGTICLVGEQQNRANNIQGIKVKKITGDLKSKQDKKSTPTMEVP
jgi:hypothetical protein